MSFSFIPVSSVIRVCSSRPAELWSAADQDGLVAFADVAACHGFSRLIFLVLPFTSIHQLSISLFLFLWLSHILPVFCFHKPLLPVWYGCFTLPITCHPFTRDPFHHFSPRNQDVRHSPPVPEVKHRPLCAPSAIFDCVPPSRYLGLLVFWVPQCERHLIFISFLAMMNRAAISLKHGWILCKYILQNSDGRCWFFPFIFCMFFCLHGCL